jgi:membrane protease YdiL (CAAX protease family)
MFYTTTNGPQMFVSQIITCTVIAIFFGYAYMKTQNIWVPVIMHYLNNNLAALLSGGGSDALQQQNIAWGDIPLFLASSIAFALFIFMPIYGKGKGEGKELTDSI